MSLTARVFVVETSSFPSTCSRGRGVPGSTHGIRHVVHLYYIGCSVDSENRAHSVGKVHTLEHTHKRTPEHTNSSTRPPVCRDQPAAISPPAEPFLVLPRCLHRRRRASCSSLEGPPGQKAAIGGAKTRCCRPVPANATGTAGELVRTGDSRSEVRTSATNTATASPPAIAVVLLLTKSERLFGLGPRTTDYGTEACKPTAQLTHRRQSPPGTRSRRREPTMEGATPCFRHFMRPPIGHHKLGSVTPPHNVGAVVAFGDGGCRCDRHPCGSYCHVGVVAVTPTPLEKEHLKERVGD